MKFSYPFNINKAEGEYFVTFPDVPEALTGAESEREAIALAGDALIAALGAYIEDRRDIPPPSEEGSNFVHLHPLKAAKVGLYIVMKSNGYSNVELANRLGVDEKAVRRMLDLDQNTKIDVIYSALNSVFDYRLVTSMEKVA